MFEWQHWTISRDDFSKSILKPGDPCYSDIIECTPLLRWLCCIWHEIASVVFRSATVATLPNVISVYGAPTFPLKFVCNQSALLLPSCSTWTFPVIFSSLALLTGNTVIRLQDGRKRRSSGLYRLWRSRSSVACAAYKSTEQTHSLNGDSICCGCCCQPGRLDLGHTRSPKCSGWRVESLRTIKRGGYETRMCHGAFVLWLDAQAVRISRAHRSLSRVWE